MMRLRSWYDDMVLPHLIRCACANQKIMQLRSKVVPLAAGSVFELGAGGGLNQPFYDRQRVTSFAGIDPAGKLLDDARAAAQAKGWEADLRQGAGEDIPYADSSFDTVVSTYTLCSVEDQAQVLSELRRILKPGGRLIYLEHGRAPDPKTAKWQRRIEPLWKQMAGNCHLTRRVGEAVRDAGFQLEPVGAYYMPKVPRWAGWMEWGIGTRADA